MSTHFPPVQALTPPSVHVVPKGFTASPQDLMGQRILITGAASGIGRALANWLTHSEVILLDKDERGLEQLAKNFVQTGRPDPLLIPFDLSSLTEDSAAELTHQIIHEYTPQPDSSPTDANHHLPALHSIVHLAGLLGELTPLQHYPPYLWRQLMSTHVESAFLLTQALAPLLQAANRAHVIFTSADEGVAPRAYWGAYAVSKAALIALTQVWAAEWQHTSRIKVNIVNTGPVATEQRRQAFPAENASLSGSLIEPTPAQS
ncbi:MAG: SDR family NAD(P)-dependent oxidoreductase [Gammaproteobacteria bacterium]